MTTFVYNAPWPVYALDWSTRADKSWRLALGSFVEDYRNKLQVVQVDEETKQLQCVAEGSHPFPITKTLFIPQKAPLRTLSGHISYW